MGQQGFAGVRSTEGFLDIHQMLVKNLHLLSRERICKTLLLVVLGKLTVDINIFNTINIEVTIILTDVIRQ